MGFTAAGGDKNTKALGEGLAAVLDPNAKPWYKQRNVLILNIYLFCLLQFSSAGGYDGSMMNGVLALPQWYTFMNNPTGTSSLAQYTKSHHTNIFQVTGLASSPQQIVSVPLSFTPLLRTSRTSGDAKPPSGSAMSSSSLESSSRAQRRMRLCSFSVVSSLDVPVLSGPLFLYC